MGFGLLFLGYIATFLMSINSFGVVFRLTGCAIMLSALSKLSRYEKGFFYVNISCFAMTAVSLFECVFGFFDRGWQYDNIKNICMSIFLVLTVIFHSLLYLAIYRISKDVGLDKLRMSSVRNAVFASIELVILLCAYVMWNIELGITKYIVMAGIIYPFIILVFNLVLIYSCYKNICEEGDEEAPRKPSKIPFLNKLFDASEKREQEIFDKTKSYAEKRIAEDFEKKKNKKKHKKKRR